MFATTKPFLLTLLLATGTAGYAQETATEDAPAEDAAAVQTQADDGATADQSSTDQSGTEQSSTEQPGGDLSLGTPIEQAEAEAEAAPRVGEPYIGAVFTDWALRCLKAEEGAADPCQLYQLLRDSDDNAVAEISMFPLAPGGQAVAGATIVAPLETLLTQQLTLQIDGGQARRYPFTFCNGAGCVARVGFTAEEVNLFKRGNSATLRMVPAAAPDDEVLLNLSLSGFTAGYTSLDSGSQ